MKGKIAALGCALLGSLVGCMAAPSRPPPVYYRDNVTAAQFDADKSQCLYEVEMRGGGSQFLDLFDLCMRGKGYTR